VWVTWIVEGVVLGTITAFVVWISMDPEGIGGLFNARPNVPASHFARAAADLRVDLAFHFVAVLLVGVLAGGWARFRRMAVMAIPVFVFINMTFVSRQLFATAPDDVVDLDVPSVYASRLTDPNFRAASEFDAVQQLLYGEEDGSLFRWARDVGMGSMWISDGIHQVWQGSFKLSKYVALFRGPGDHDRSARDRLADMLAIRWMVAGAADPLDIFWGGGSRQARVIERTTALPRVRLVSEWDAWPADEEGAMARVIRQPPLSGSALVEPVALVDGRPTRRAVSPAMANQRPGTLHAVEFTANTIRAVADLDSTNLLVIADTWYPGWTAHVDGAPVEIFRVNGLFRGIFLPPGQHRVELRYRPRYWTSTILVSVIAAIVLGACVVSAIGRRSSRSAMPKHAAKPSFERGAARGAARFVGGCGTPR
jgi:hypothetical protein